MSAVETKIDKSKWADGPWKTEPDRKEWEYNGLSCLIVRVNSHGALCGYVAVPPNHPWHGKGYDDLDVDVHGGLTYAQPCTGAVCHVPKPGEPDNVWWLGFDHAHHGDLCPGRQLSRDRSHTFGPGRNEDDGSFPDRGVYRDMSYVTDQVELLAQQVFDTLPLVRT